MVAQGLRRSPSRRPVLGRAMAGLAIMQVLVMSSQEPKSLPVDSAPPRCTPLDVIRRAREVFLAGQRVEMQGLAAELGVSRVTIHRWVGTRDELLAEVMWSMGERVLREARQATRGVGGPGIAETFELFLTRALGAPFMRAFLAREPEIALRILTTQRTPFQARLVAAVKQMLVEEIDAGRLEPPLAVDDLAYVTVRLAESFSYADVIAGGTADPGKARQAIAALLR